MSTGANPLARAPADRRIDQTLWSAECKAPTRSGAVATLQRLLRSAGCDLVAEVEPRPVLDRERLEDVRRILRMSPEERLREVANVSRFLAGARPA
jgi:hypothetical protein